MVKKIIQESINRSPIGVKEALAEELRSRISVALVERIDESSQGEDEKAEAKRNKMDKLLTAYEPKNKTTKRVSENLDEADAVLTHKWYSVKHWKDGSDHFDNLDNALGKDTYKHAALGNTGLNRPDHHLGIPVSNKKAIAYMDKHAKVASMKEEVEELDELSQETLGAYVKKAHNQRRKDIIKNHDDKRYVNQFPSRMTTKDHAEYGMLKRAIKKRSDRIAKRTGGIEKAKSRLNNEEADLTEISKSTLGSYIKGARGSYGAAVDKLARTSAKPGNDPERKKTIATMIKRHNGIDGAVHRLIRSEEVELDENVKFVKDGDDGYHEIHHNGKQVGHISQNNFAEGGYSVKIGGNSLKHEVSVESSLAKAKESAKYHLNKLKEETEELDEISKSTLASYAKKAASELGYKALPNSQKNLLDKGELDKKFNLRKTINRTLGIQKASDRLVKEDEDLKETAVEQGLEDHHPRVVSGVKGVRSTPFTKKFRNAEHMEKWMDSDDYSNHEVHHIEKA